MPFLTLRMCNSYSILGSPATVTVAVKGESAATRLVQVLISLPPLPSLLSPLPSLLSPLPSPLSPSPLPPLPSLLPFPSLLPLPLSPFSPLPLSLSPSPPLPSPKYWVGHISLRCLCVSLPFTTPSPPPPPPTHTSLSPTTFLPSSHLHPLPPILTSSLPSLPSSHLHPPPSHPHIFTPLPPILTSSLPSLPPSYTSQTNGEGVEWQHLVNEYVCLLTKCANHLGLLLPDKTPSKRQKQKVAYDYHLKCNLLCT